MQERPNRLIVQKPNEKFRQARKDCGLNQQQLADELKVDVQTVARWDKGENIPTEYQRRRLVKRLGRSEEDLGWQKSQKVGYESEPSLSTSSPTITNYPFSISTDGEAIGTQADNGRNNGGYAPELKEVVSDQHEANGNSENNSNKTAFPEDNGLYASRIYSENNDNSHHSNHITISFLHFIFGGQNRSQSVINQPTSNHLPIRTIALLLISFLVVGSVGAYFVFQGKNDVSRSSSSQGKTASTTQVLPSHSPNDTHSVFTFLTDFCNHLKSGEYQHIFDQLTTVSYQRNNPSALKDFSFADKDGEAICILPDQDHIMIPPPLYITTDCFIGLKMQNKQKFNHRYELKKQNNSTWKISNEASTTEQENQLTPQCGNFPIL